MTKFLASLAILIAAITPAAALDLKSMGANASGQLGDSTTTDHAIPVLVAGDVVQIAAAGGGNAGEANHSFYLKSDGTLWAMGCNSSGQLGDGTTTDRTTPVQVATGVQQVATGETHSLFVKTNGTLWAMGKNEYGQLGDSTTVDRLSPVQVGSGITCVAAGDSFTLLVNAAGELWGVGRGDDFQLGDGANRPSPTKITDAVTRVVACAAHSLFLKTDKTLWRMGSGGTAGSSGPETSPSQLADDVVQFATGGSQGLIIKTNGSLWVVGSNSNGQLGLGTSAYDRSMPEQLLTGISAVAAGLKHSLFAKTDGTLWAMGYNHSGQLGDGTTTDRYTPVQVAAEVSRIAAGGDHSLFLQAPQKPVITSQTAEVVIAAGQPATLSVTAASTTTLRYQWYSGTSGDTANPIADAQASLFSTPALATSANFWVKVQNDIGSTNSLTLAAIVTPAPAVSTQPTSLSLTLGDPVLLTVVASGQGLTYRWYRGASGDTSSPVDAGTRATLVVPPIITTTSFWVRITNPAGHADSASALLTVVPPTATDLMAMGYNFSGQLGDGTTTNRSTPVRLATGVAQIAAGNYDSWFLKTDGTLWVAGSANGSDRQQPPSLVASNVGQIAAGLFVKTDGTLWAIGSILDQFGFEWPYSSTPVQVASGVSSVTEGAIHTAFVKADGTLWTTGYNNPGQLGDGTTTSRKTPIQVADNVGSVAAGDYRTLFIKLDGTLWATGDNYWGGLGDGTETSKSTPVCVASDVRMVASGNSQSLFVKTDGTLWGMGYNSYGQLGDGAFDRHASPIQIAAGISMVAAGYEHSLFVKTNGTLWAMGRNDYGQLGDGTTIDRRSPVLIAPGVSRVATKFFHSLFLQIPQSPKITAQPADVVILAGQTAELAVTATSPRAITYQWYRGGSGDTSHPAAGAIAATFTTPAVSETTKFWVCVTNDAGPTNSQAASVIVPVAPAVTVQPTNVSIGYGGYAVLSVSGSGGGLHYQWYRGVKGDISSPVIGAVGPNLVLPPLTANGTFWARVTNSAGAIDSNSAQVTVALFDAIELWSTGDNSAGQLCDGTNTRRYSPVKAIVGVAQVAASGGNTLFIKTDGSLWGMGSNANAQLGNGTTTAPTSPIQIDTGVAQVATGGGHSLFIKANGSLWAMGDNGGGQLGDGTMTNRTTPVLVATGVAQVAAGDGHSLFVKTDATLWAMGYNPSGQLGDGTTTNSATPVQIATGVARVFSGAAHSMFLKLDGTLWAMGSNQYGQLGTGKGNSNERIPVQVAVGVAEAATGGAHSLYVTEDGTLFATGFNVYGELGDSSYTSKDGFVQVATDVSQVAAGGSHSLFITNDGTLLSAGTSAYGQLGTGTESWYNAVPTIVAHRVGRVVAGSANSFFLQIPPPPEITSQPAGAIIAAGQTAPLSVVVSSELTVTYQWYVGTAGDTAHPIAGAMSSSFTTSPLFATTQYWVRVTSRAGATDSLTASVIVTPPPSITIQPANLIIAYGGNAALSVACSGEGLTYQWYRDATGDTSRPIAGATSSVLVRPPFTATASFWVRITNPAGVCDSQTGTVTVSPDYLPNLRAMGSNYGGQLGDGTTTQRKSPVSVASGIRQISGAYSHTLWIDSAGTLWAVGDNAYGQLGDGTRTSHSAPIQVTTGVRHVAAGGQTTTGGGHSLFVKADGSLWAMGDNSVGQLGDGSSTTRTSPVQVATNVAQVSAGTGHSVFIKTDGSLWAMGRNTRGQLGDGSPDYAVQKSPVQVATDVIQVVAAEWHTLFLKADGSLWVMGYNINGQLGAGTSYEVRSPMQIATDVAQISSSNEHSLFIKTNGTLWGMGDDTFGQLGDSATTTRYTPIQIGTGFANVAAGNYFSLLVKLDGTLLAVGGNFYGELGDGTTTAKLVPFQAATGIARVTTGYGRSFLLTAATIAITGQPVPQIARVGTAASFAVQVACPAALTYRWRKDGIEITGTNASTFNLGSVQLADAGSYDVIATSTAGTVTSAKATLTVHTENQISFAAWAAAGAVSGGALGDPDGTGVANLLRYAFKLPAHGPVASPTAVAIEQAGGENYLTISFNRKTYAPDLRYIVEGSSDMVNWSAITTLAAGIPENMIVPDTVPLRSATRRFMRVRVTTVP